jgi:hypothetical protein
LSLHLSVQYFFVFGPVSKVLSQFLKLHSLKHGQSLTFTVSLSETRRSYTIS